MNSIQRNFRIAGQLIRGRTIYRALFNNVVLEECTDVQGLVLDIAGDRKADYCGYFNRTGVQLKTVNIKEDADIVADFNARLPFDDASIDCLLLFNALYIAESQDELFRELYRILRPGGQVFFSSPYISNEMREPHDYLRLTSEGIERLCQRSNLRILRCRSFGERFTAAMYLLHPFFLVAPIRLVAGMLALMLDSCIPQKVLKAHPAPLGYFVACTRDQ